MPQDTLRGSLVQSLEALTSVFVPAVCPATEDWTLSCCCGTVQQQIIGAVCVYTLLIFLLWPTPVLKPLKLLVVALHEFGHASAAWMTCGKVLSIDVDSQEGGVTKTVGGSRIIILLAGYLGSAFWGMIIIIASADFYGVQVISAVLCFALLICLFFAGDWLLRGLTILFLVIVAAFWACTILTPFNGLRFVMLLVGTMSALFSIYDIYDDLLRRRVNESDATMLANYTHTSSRCWGAIFAVISVIFLGLAIYLSLIVGGAPGQK